MVNDIAVQDFVNAIKEQPTDPNTTYNATVSKVDKEGVVWVNIYGSDKETPTSSTSAEVKKGDTVTVNWRNNKLYIGGNYSNPSAGVTTVSRVENVANNAQSTADVAYMAANNAVADAERAATAANDAETSAARAETAAGEAQSSADVANLYANTALSQLSIVQDVVGVLDLLSTNAEYQLTTDETVQQGKWYFTRSGTSPNYIYTVVTNPVDSELSTYYEIVSIDDAVKNYVTSKLAVTEAGLWVQDPSIQTKVLLSPTDGVVLYGTDGKQVGKYGSTAQVGNPKAFHITMSGERLGFWKGDENTPENEIAYISGQKLYITQSVVLQQMDIGTPVNDGGQGQWSWMVHPNSENPPRSNLHLKWIG